jgi:hypothetical protein
MRSALLLTASVLPAADDLVFGTARFTVEWPQWRGFPTHLIWRGMRYDSLRRGR